MERPQEENGCGEASEMDKQFFGVADSDGCREGSSGWDGLLDGAGAADNGLRGG